ncbi:MAG: hypothetical protein KFF73_00680 [Cyclobacteriaceae bacterium]|nr:hypothetical protein [Cyclobacteriaceae bacterium]
MKVSPTGLRDLTGDIIPETDVGVSVKVAVRDLPGCGLDSCLLKADCTSPIQTPVAAPSICINSVQFFIE